MLTFFSNLMSGPTKVYISFNMNSFSTSNLSANIFSTGYRPCISNDNFQEIYNDIFIKLLSEGNAIMTLSIELTGKLKGRAINQKFDNLDSFRDFLKRELLISQESHPELRPG